MTVEVRPSEARSALLSAPVLLRIDRRRAASWLSLVAAACGLACLASLAAVAGLPVPVASLLVGAVLVVAAVGDLPIGACRQPPATSSLAVVWLVERAAWPVAGLISAAAALSVIGDTTDHWQRIVAPALVGAAAAATTLHLLRRSGANAADASSLTMTMAVAAAWVGWPADGVAAGFGNLFAAVAAWGAIGVLVRAIDRRWGSGWEWLPDVERQPRSLRKLLTATAMIAALFGMVSWFFLDPSRAASFSAMAIALYVGLAVPEATLGDGVSDTVAWRRLHRSAAGPASGLVSVRPGRGWTALVAAVSNAAILGWPPLVAAALLAGRGGAAREAAGAVLVLVLAAAVLVAIAWMSELLRAAADTAHAAAIAVAAVIAIVFAIAIAARPAPQANRPACLNCPRNAAAMRPFAGNGRLVTLRKWRVPATLPLHHRSDELG
jgi:hypothetical protein